MKRRDLTSGNVTRSLLTVAIPTMISQLLTFSYNIIDLKFVSSLGTQAVAAVGSASLYIGFGAALNSLCVVGTGILVSHAIGNDDLKMYQKALNAGYFINLIVNTFIALIFILFAKQLIGIQNISDQVVVDLGAKYIQIMGITIFFQLTNNLITRILSSLGLTDKTLYINLVGIILNIILDAVFIFGLGFGVTGAAIASLLASFAMTLLFLLIYNSTLMFSFKSPLDFAILKNTIRLGVPYMFQRILFTVVGIWLGRIIAEFGTHAIAAQKIGLQVESLTFLTIGGLFAAMAAFAGQNLGSGNYDRIKEGYTKAIKIGIAYALFTSTLFLLFANQIASLFDKSPDTIQYTAYYLRIIAIGQAFAVLEMVGNGLYSGIGKPRIPATVSISITVLRVPFAIILSSIIGVSGVFLSIVITTIMKGLISYGIYKFKISKQIGTSIIFKKA